MSTPIVVLVAVQGDPRDMAPTIRSVREAFPGNRLLLVAGRPGNDLGLLAAMANGEVFETPSLASATNSLRDWPDSDAGPGDAYPAHVLVINAPVLFANGSVDPVAASLDDDMRVASVSFLSNDAGYLSVPERNRPTHHQVGSHDEHSLNELLSVPKEGVLRLASIPAPAGRAHLLSRHALSACGGLQEGLGLSPSGVVSEFALRAQRRGFVSAVAANCLVLAPWDLGRRPVEPMEDPAERALLGEMHPFVLPAYDYARNSPESPVGIVVGSTSVKIRGLRLAIDGTCLGDKEMGTQVQTLALANALARREDVAHVTIVTNGPVPGYAQATFDNRKIEHVRTVDSDFSHLPSIDVLHRPYQPDSTLPIADWRASARRVVVTLQDLIAYQVGAYSSDGDTWLRYRSALRDAAAGSDGVVVISHDTKRQLAFERLPVQSDRIFVVPNGTDHLSGEEATLTPRELTSRGFLAQRFLVVLGANYGHKNRDLAIKAWKLLRTSFPDLSLVLAGAAVPFGSTRVSESLASAQADEGLFVLPDVTSQERNWLLRHAEVVLYPTAAEGFGLVPFEAARFGTPTANVGFGPLSEVNPGNDSGPATWSPSDFAAAVGAMLEDPALRSRKVASTLAAGAEYTWASTAAGLVRAYRTILAQPPNLIA